ncbi:DPP IV N-terminal domain-containing protein, partial [Lishizhenia sp.]|uniref:DPP IV N-terminal domain-containing protein n=1 Tax=Lishizhenia sp. TaxID=2497594 RepID=UPI00299DE7A7
MFKKLVVMTCVGLSMLAYGQKETLTIESAVMNQYRKYYPEHIMGFSWIPNSDNFSYLGAYTSLLEGSGKKANSVDTIAKIAEVNAAVNGKLRWFSGFDWISGNEFMVVEQGKKFYSYNVDTDAGKLFAELKDGSANAKVHTATQTVAYTVDNNVFINKGNKNIQVTQHTDPNIVAGQAFARSEFGITEGLFWSEDGNYLAFYQKDESEVHDYPMLDNSTYPGELKSIKYPMAGQKSEKPSVGIYNVAKGSVVYITPRGEEDAYLTNVTFTPDEKFFLIAEVNRGQNEMNLNKYTVEGEFVATLITEKSETWTEPEHPAYFPKEGSNNFIWISEQDGYNNLYYYTIDGELIQKLTSNKFVTKDIISSTSKEVYYYATGDNGMNTMVYKVDYSGNQSLVTEVEGTHSVAVSPSGKYIFDQYSNHTTPNVAQMITSKGKVSNMLTAKNPYENVTMGTAEISTIKSADGTTDLYQRLIKPSNF